MPHDLHALEEKIYPLLTELTGLPDLQDFPDLDLFEEGLLDSLTLVRLMVDLSTEFGIELTPADMVREEWSTPRKILQAVEARLPA